MAEEDPEVKSYSVYNNKVIKTIRIHKTKNPPETQCYLSANYSQKRKTIFCVGGTNKNCEQLPFVFGYKVDDNKWVEYQDDNPFDKPITGHTGNIIEDKGRECVFIFAGFGEGDDYTRRAYSLPTSDMSFEQVEFRKNKEGIAEYPLPRSYHTANYDPKTKRVLIYGGTDMNISNSKRPDFQSLWEFNIEGAFWNKKNLITNKKGAPRGHTSILFERNLYIFGGVVLFKQFTNTLFKINIDTYTVENVDYTGDKPVPVAFHGAEIVGERGFLVQGGLDQNYNAISNCYFYEFKTKSFSEIKIPLIPKIFGHKLVAVPDKNSIFIVGGMDSFEYVGDKNLIFKPEKESDNIIEQNEEEIKFTPMVELFEMEIINQQ